jgi:hypothetical protein
MKVKLYIGSGCHGGSCPTIYESDRDTFIVQGNLMKPNEINDLAIPSNEGVVEIPRALAQALADKLAKG